MRRPIGQGMRESLNFQPFFLSKTKKTPILCHITVFFHELTPTSTPTSGNWPSINSITDVHTSIHSSKYDETDRFPTFSSINSKETPDFMLHTFKKSPIVSDTNDKFFPQHACTCSTRSIRSTQAIVRNDLTAPWA